MCLILIDAPRPLAWPARKEVKVWSSQLFQSNTFYLTSRPFPQRDPGSGGWYGKIGLLGVVGGSEMSEAEDREFRKKLEVDLRGDSLLAAKFHPQLG